MGKYFNEKGKSKLWTYFFLKIDYILTKITIYIIFFRFINSIGGITYIWLVVIVKI